MTNEAFLTKLTELDKLRTQAAQLQEAIAAAEAPLVDEFLRRKIDEFAIADENKANLIQKTETTWYVDQFEDICVGLGIERDKINKAVVRKVVAAEARKLLSGDELKRCTRTKKKGAPFITFTGGRTTRKPVRSAKRKTAV